MRRSNPGHLHFTTDQFLESYWPIFAWAFLYLLIAGAIQFNIPYPWDYDTAYHAAMGKLIRSHGILHSFPWTPFSWLYDNWADDELLFHLLFVPFANLNWITASQIVGTLAGATILSVFYVLFRTERVPFAGLWALVPLACSLLFIFRFILVRPHLLSISLSLIFLWAAVRGRMVVLAVVSAIYPLVYIAFWQLPCLLLIAAETAHFLSGKGIRWKPAAVAFAGIAAGVVVHPNALNLLKYNWIVMYYVLFKIGWLTDVGFDMGAELKPFPLGGWVQGLMIPVLFLITSSILAWRNRRNDMLSLAFMFVALGFCVLTVRSARFAEYFVPFSVAATALSLKSVTRRFLAPAILGISLAYTLWVGYPTLSDITSLQNKMPPDIAQALQQQIPPGSQVFTTDWFNTGLLMLALPDRLFLVTQDPTFLYLKDPELYKVWYTITHDAPPGTAGIIRQRFNSRYVIVSNPLETAKFSYRLFSEPGVRLLLNTNQWMLFDLGKP